MSDGEPERADLAVTLYELLQHQVEHERRWQFIRFGGGMAVTGAIIGYAFLTGQLSFLAVTPILYGVVVMDALRSNVTILYLHRHMIRLESKLRSREPLFHWVSRYGTFGDGQSLETGDVDLNAIPNLALYALLVSVYFLLIALSLRTWSPLEQDAPLFGVAATRDLLVLGYTSFTALFLVIVLVGYVHYRRLQDDVAAERP